MTWLDALERYQERLRVRGHAASTRDGASRSLLRFRRFCDVLGLQTPLEVTASHLAAYRQSLLCTPTRRGRLARPATVAGLLGGARGFLRWLVAAGHLLVDPTRDLVLPAPPRPLPRLLTVAEVTRLLQQPSPRTLAGRRDRAMLELLYGVGLRREECRRLDLTDLDRAQALVRVRQTKNRRDRHLPLGPHLLEVLTLYLEQSRPRLLRSVDEPALFVSGWGRRISGARIQQVVASAAQAAGLGLVGPHALRHACATHLLARGADLREVQALLGHVRVTSTQAYTHLQPLEVFETHAQTHPRARRPDKA